MKKLVYLLAGVTIILQSQSHWIFWPILAMTVAMWKVEDEFALYLIAFVLGILSDLVSGRTLGEGAVFLILFVLAGQAIKLRFKNSLKINLGVAFIFGVVYFFLVSWFNF